MISRRSFLKTVAVAGAALYPFKKAFASLKSEKVLNLFHIHTGESLNIRYYKSGEYIQSALNEINHFLRCHFTNEIKEIDTALLDLLFNIASIFGNNRQIEIISGYRSAAYNDYLGKIGRRVGKNSLHLQGLAIDLNIPGVSNFELAHVAKSFSAGGVGRYSKFVHIDVGQVRYW